MLQHHLFSSVTRYQVIKMSQRSSIHPDKPETNSQFRSGSLGLGQWKCSDGAIMEEGNSDRCQQVGTQIMENYQTSHLSFSCDLSWSWSRTRRTRWSAWSSCSGRSWSTWSSGRTCRSGRTWCCRCGTGCCHSAYCWEYFRLAHKPPPLSWLTWHSCGRRCGCCSHWGWGCRRGWRPCDPRRRLTSSLSWASASGGSLTASGSPWAASPPGSGASWAGRHWTWRLVYSLVFTLITLTHHSNPIVWKWSSLLTQF